MTPAQADAPVCQPRAVGWATPPGAVNERDGRPSSSTLSSMGNPGASWQIWLENWALDSGDVPEMARGDHAQFAVHAVIVGDDGPHLASSSPQDGPSAEHLGLHTRYDIVAQVVAVAGRTCVLDIGPTVFSDRRALPPGTEPGSWVRGVVGLEVDPTGDLYRGGAGSDVQAAITGNWVIEEVWLDQTAMRTVKWGDLDYPHWSPNEGPKQIRTDVERWLAVEATRRDDQGRYGGYRLVARPRPPSGP